VRAGMIPAAEKSSVDWIEAFFRLPL
jgi:hypothetical protein